MLFVDSCPASGEPNNNRDTILALANSIHKVYLLSEDLDNIVFANREHKATTFNAKTSFSESPLFYEGANGFRISRPADIDDEEFYVLLNAEYGNSGN